MIETPKTERGLNGSTFPGLILQERVLVGVNPAEGLKIRNKRLDLTNIIHDCVTENA